MVTCKRDWLALIGAVVVGAIWLVGVRPVQSQPPAEAVAEVHPAADQTYTGSKQCASCHLKAYLAWKKTKHATAAFESMPAKYRASADCLACHSTGYGAATGFKDIASTPNLAGTTCEACHGPGSKHAAIAKQYENKKLLAPDEDKAVRGSIYKIEPQNVCVRCHIDQQHKAHPPYDKQ